MSEPTSREPRGPRGGPWPKSKDTGRAAAPGGGVSLVGVSSELRIESAGVRVSGVTFVAGVTFVGVTFAVTTFEPKSEPCRWQKTRLSAGFGMALGQHERTTFTPLDR